MSHQRTIDRPVQCQGIGLHTGEKVTMTLRPSPANRGVIFRRVDLPDAPAIEARPEYVANTQPMFPKQSPPAPFADKVSQTLRVTHGLPQVPQSVDAPKPISAHDARSSPDTAGWAK